MFCALFGTYTKKILIVYGKCQPNWRPGLDLKTLDVSSFGVSAISCLFLQCCKSRRKGGAGGRGQGTPGASIGRHTPHRAVVAVNTRAPAPAPVLRGWGWGGGGALGGRWSMAPNSHLCTHREPADWCVCGIKSSKWSFRVKACVRVSFFKSRGDFPEAQWLRLHAPSAGGQFDPWSGN